MSEHFKLNPKSKAFFPSHGWIAGTTGIRQLRFPLLRVFQLGHPSYVKYQDLKLDGIWLQTRSPFRTLRQLGIALRDLHCELRMLLLIANGEWLGREVGEERNRALTQQSEGLEQCEVLLLSIFVLLRRLADDIMGSLRPALFECWHSAPSQLKKAITLAEAGRVDSLRPFCDTESLSEVLTTKTGWLDRLRKEDGVRDMLIHWPHILQVGPLGTKPADSERFSWQITASLVVQSRDGVQAKSLFPLLLECLAGACDFMTAICRLLPGVEDFDRGDLLFLTGCDNDIVGFWPSVEGAQHEFPLLT